VPKVSDAASFGAMILACRGAGVIDDLAEASTTLNPPQRVYRPDREARAVYDQLYPIYNDFYASVESLFERLDAVGTS
jgi:xylulokinase